MHNFLEECFKICSPYFLDTNSTKQTLRRYQASALFCSLARSKAAAVYHIITFHWMEANPFAALANTLLMTILRKLHMFARKVWFICIRHFSPIILHLEWVRDQLINQLIDPQIKTVWRIFRSLWQLIHYQI